MFYEDLPMILLQVGIVSGSIDFGDLMESNAMVVYIGLGTTCLSISVAFLVWYLESTATDASLTQLSFENMTARISWVPFQKALYNCDEILNINFGMLDAPLPYLSHRLGIYKRVLYQFNRRTFQTFTA